MEIQIFQIHAPSEKIKNILGYKRTQQSKANACRYSTEEKFRNAHENICVTHAFCCTFL